MAQDDEIRALERQALAGDAQAGERLLAAQRRALCVADAEYLLAYLRLADEVSGSQGWRIADILGRYGQTAEDHAHEIGGGQIHLPVVEPRSRPVSEVLADLAKLNDDYVGRVSSPRLIRKELATLEAFREGVDVGCWSSSTLGCMPSEEYGNDPNVVNFVGDATVDGAPFEKGRWAKLGEKADAVERDWHRGRVERCRKEFDNYDENRCCILSAGHVGPCRRHDGKMLEGGAS